MCVCECMCCVINLKTTLRKLYTMNTMIWYSSSSSHDTLVMRLMIILAIIMFVLMVTI